MSKPYLKRFERGEKADPLKFTPRDTAILRDVYEYRFLNTEQLLALHSGGRRNLLRRLAALFKHDCLDRPTVQKKAHLSSSHLVYSLGREGVNVLAKSAEEREGILRRVRENKRTSSLIVHALMISQFRVCLTLALKSRPDITLTRWVQGDSLKTLLRRRGENPPLVADAFFILTKDGWKYPCFLEADRATETNPRFIEKLRMYWRHNREKRFKESLGIESFRVLTITQNERHAKNLCRDAKDADDRHIGSPMYLFTSETSYSLSTPDALLQAIWSSPPDDLLHAIIE